MPDEWSLGSAPNRNAASHPVTPHWGNVDGFNPGDETGIHLIVRAKHTARKEPAFLGVVLLAVFGCTVPEKSCALWALIAL
jgi:hypothetical protein